MQSKTSRILPDIYAYIAPVYKYTPRRLSPQRQVVPFSSSSLPKYLLVVLLALESKCSYAQFSRSNQTEGSHEEMIHNAQREYMPQTVPSVAVLVTLVTTFNFSSKAIMLSWLSTNSHIVVHFYWYSSISKYSRNVKVKIQLFMA